MLDYKDIITKHYALGMSGMAIAKSLNASPSGVNDFLRAFKECKSLGFPLPQGITNYGIAEAVYGKNPAIAGRDLSYEMPDYEAVEKDMSSRKNMTLVVLWNRYAKKCRDCGLKFYSYRQFCENYAKWCEENKETLFRYTSLYTEIFIRHSAGLAFLNQYCPLLRTVFIPHCQYICHLITPLCYFLK